MPTIDFQSESLYNSIPGHVTTGESDASPPGFKSRVSREHESYLSWLAFLDSVEIRWPMKIQAGVYYEGYIYGTYLNLQMSTKERDFDPWAPSNFTVGVSLWLPLFEECPDPARLLRDHCLGLLQHEFDEQLLVNGERVFDPHDAQRRLYR